MDGKMKNPLEADFGVSGLNPGRLLSALFGCAATSPAAIDLANYVNQGAPHLRVEQSPGTLCLGDWSELQSDSEFMVLSRLDHTTLHASSMD